MFDVRENRRVERGLYVTPAIFFSTAHRITATSFRIAVETEENSWERCVQRAGDDLGQIVLFRCGRKLLSCMSVRMQECGQVGISSQLGRNPMGLCG